ncbi:hypothetical protein ACFQX7_22565 [Luedemannella flava]|uniref:hypothetical protein n=1 Tax=Luedemannella flava TaxID=349316 RepID=UPI0031CF43DC
MTLPLTCSMARSVRGYAIYRRVVGYLLGLLILGSVAALGSHIWEYHSLSGFDASVLLGLIVVADRARGACRPEVRVERSGDRLRITGLSGQFAAATVDLNPEGTVTMRRPVDE